MLPIIPFLLVVGIIALAVKSAEGSSPPTAGPAGLLTAGTPRAIAPVKGTRMKGALARPFHRVGEETGVTPARRLSPEEERLLSLLVLFARDKRYAAGQKRYLTAEMAVEALLLTKQLGLPKTGLAIRKDGAIPDDEFLRGRSGSVRQLVLSYGTGGRIS
jgi:hypothetical protein